MFKHLFTNRHGSTNRLCLAICLGAGLVLLEPMSTRRLALHAERAGQDPRGAESWQKAAQNESGGPTRGPRQMAGAEARTYLQEPGEGQSLMQAITAARFGLKRQEHGPLGEAGAGYLGMSHVQNLNAWFAEAGVTVRPTVVEEERERSWHTDLRLKAYGYGNDLVAAPPIVSQKVKDNRIEYERGNFELRNANFEVKQDSLFSPQPAIRNPKFVEWYENRAEGIEQGFTISDRPERKSTVGTDELLRLVVSLKGDLRAHAGHEGGRTIERTDSRGTPALNYSRLTALDAGRKQLAARMEVSTDGTEIALLV